MPHSIVTGRFLDIACNPGDVVEIEIQQRANGKVIYVHVNGVTSVRICRVGTLNIFSGRDE